VLKLVFSPFKKAFDSWIYKTGVVRSASYYRLGIKPGKEYFDRYAGQVVLLKEGQKYKLQLTNNYAGRCNCIVTIDGKEIGIFRLEPYSRYTIERPVNDVGYFTFHKDVNDPLNRSNSSNPAVSNKGLITARFVPEGYANNRRNKKKQAAPASMDQPGGSIGYSNDDNEYENRKSFSSGAKSKSRSTYEILEESKLVKGITKFEGESNQHFTTVVNMPTAENAAVLITLRLAAFRNDDDKKNK